MSEEEPPFEDPSPEDEIDLAKIHGSILREHDEPVEGYESVPLWLVTVIMVLVFWGGWYLAFYSGGFRADTFIPRRGMASKTIDNDPSRLGERIYTQNCGFCHQADGLGVPGVYPPLSGSEWVLARDWRGDNHLVNIVLYGLQGPLSIGDMTYNGAMPGWGFLRDAEIAAVLTYIRSQWKNSALPITPEFVARARAQTAGRGQAWSLNELKSVSRASESPPMKVSR